MTLAINYTFILLIHCPIGVISGIFRYGRASFHNHEKTVIQCLNAVGGNCLRDGYQTQYLTRHPQLAVSET